MSDTINCEFCGAKLAARYIESPFRPPGKHDDPKPRYRIGYELCGCEGARNERMERMEREEAERAKEQAIRLANKLRASGVPERYLGAEHDMAPAMADSVSAGKGFYLDGPQGTGKTHLAYSVARICIDRGIKTACVSSTALMEAYRNRNREDAELTRRLKACKLLVIDDLGKESPTQYACERLFEIIDTRYNSMRPIIVTSNYSRGEIARKLTEGDVGKSIASRLSEMTQRIHIDGEDRRLNRG